MSYSQSLDEISEAKLAQELSRRAKLRAVGLCDYCSREPSTRPCKFPARHHNPRSVRHAVPAGQMSLFEPSQEET